MARGRGVIGAAMLAAVTVSCGGSKAAAPTATTTTTTSTTTTIASQSAVDVSETSPVVYVLHTADGVTVRFTILAPPDHELVRRVKAYHDGVGETRPLRMVLAEIDNRSTKDVVTPDLEVTERDGDKVHFIEAWLHVGDWRRNIRGQSDSPFYMEGFDLDNELVARGIVEAGTSSVTVLAAEDFVESVLSATARDQTGEMVPIQRER
jgi:hypothetical protein